MAKGSPLRMLGRLKTAFAAAASARSWWPAGIDCLVVIAVVVAVVACAFWESQAIAIGAVLLAALGLLLSTLGLFSLQVAISDGYADRAAALDDDA